VYGICDKVTYERFFQEIQGRLMKEEEKAKKYDQLKKEIKKGANPIKIDDTEYIVISEELIKWMTEGTGTNMTPRSDCG